MSGYAIVVIVTLIMFVGVMIYLLQEPTDDEQRLFREHREDADLEPALVAAQPVVVSGDGADPAQHRDPTVPQPDTGPAPDLATLPADAVPADPSPVLEVAPPLAPTPHENPVDAESPGDSGADGGRSSAD